MHLSVQYETESWLEWCCIECCWVKLPVAAPSVLLDLLLEVQFFKDRN